MWWQNAGGDGEKGMQDEEFLREREEFKANVDKRTKLEIKKRHKKGGAGGNTQWP